MTPSVLVLRSGCLAEIKVLRSCDIPADINTNSENLVHPEILVCLINTISMHLSVET